MRKHLFVALASLWLHASTLSELFEALRHQPITQIDTKKEQIAKLSWQKATDQLYPTLTLFGSYEHYTSDTNLRPVPPPEANSRIARHEPLPFAQNIQRLGISATMPIFVKSIYTLRSKLAHLHQAAKLKKRLNLYQNEAIILGAYANLLALHQTRSALLARRHSLQKMRQDIEVAVRSGHKAPIALDKIDSTLANLAIAMQELNIKEAQAKDRIASLVGTPPKKLDPIEQIGTLKEGEFFALKALRQKLAAASKDIALAKDALFPKLLLEGRWSENYAQKDVLFGESLHTGYGEIALKLALPLSKANITDIELAKAKHMQEQSRYAQTRQELRAKAKSLQAQREALQRAIEAAKRKIVSQKALVRYAKTAYRIGRLSEEEYLRYEEGLFFAQADLAKLQAAKWQLLAQLAVIYGNDLERIVR